MNFTNTLAAQIYNALINDPTYVESVKSKFVITGYVGDCDLTGKLRPGAKVYAFVGNGCGITWLTFDGRSKKAKEVNEIIHEVRRACDRYLYGQFDDEAINYFQSIGSPVMAVLQQDQEIQQEFYSRVVAYCKQVLGIKKIGYRSVLD